MGTYDGNIQYVWGNIGMGERSTVGEYATGENRPGEYTVHLRGNIPGAVGI